MREEKSLKFLLFPVMSFLQLIWEVLQNILHIVTCLSFAFIIPILLWLNYKIQIWIFYYFMNVFCTFKQLLITSFYTGIIELICYLNIFIKFFSHCFIVTWFTLKHALDGSHNCIILLIVIAINLYRCRVLYYYTQITVYFLIASAERS